MNLQQFLADPQVTNQWIKEPGFSGLYVRKGAVGFSINGQHYVVTKCLTIANVTAKHPGDRAFTILIANIEEHYGIPIFVENVLERRFENRLLKLGFTRVDLDDALPSFIKGWRDHLRDKDWTYQIPVIYPR